MRFAFGGRHCRVMSDVNHPSQPGPVPPLPSREPDTRVGVGAGAGTSSAITGNKEARLWAMSAHLSGFLGHLVPFFGNIIGPLVVWVLKKDQFPLVDDQGKEALNFQITMTIYFALAGALCWVLIGFVILPVLWIFYVVVMIIAAVRANEGASYRYPMTLRFVR